MLTFQSPSVAVAVCTRASLLIHSIVSPTFAFTSAGVKTSLSIVTCIVSARAETERPNITQATKTIRSGVMAEFLLFQVGRDVLGVLLVALENLQAGLQQTFELAVAGRGNKRAFKRAIHGLVVFDFVGDIGLVKSGTVELRKFVTFGRGLLGQRAAGVVVFRLHL